MSLFQQRYAALFDQQPDMTYNELLDKLLVDLGGCGIYQILLGAIIHVGKTIATWSMITMTFAGQSPGFRCIVGNYTNASSSDDHIGNISLIDKCDINGITCDDHVFGDQMRTVVTEFDLVCDRKWITAAITTIQMGGVLLGCAVSGHLADLIGRKPTHFMGILMMVVSNAAGYFSPTWIVYAVIRFVIGIGTGFYVTVQFCITNEFTTSKWRPAIVMTPSWAFESGLFALAAWGFHDWQKIHLAISIIGAPFLLTWWILPESFRWLVTRQRFVDAEKVIGVIAKMNKKDKPDLTKIFAAAKESQGRAKTAASSKKHYSALDLFSTKSSAKMTVGLLFAWFAANYGYYGITFGVKRLSGDLYMNMFLINIVESPAMILTSVLVSWFGRKKVTFAFYLLAGITGIAVGVIQYTDAPIDGLITNIIALVAKLSVACGGQAMKVYTTELYPTVVRTIAYGVHSTSGKVGGMVAPQIVFLDDEVPGILYFLSGVLMMISAVIMLMFRETKDAVLGDTLDDEIEFTVEGKRDKTIENNKDEKLDTQL